MPNTEQNESKLTEADLRNFYGSDQIHRHQMSGYLYTDGMEFIAEKAGAYWLLDAIFSYRLDPKIRKNQGLQEFQLWELKKDEENPSGCILTMRDDSGEGSTEFVRQVIEYTDFPLDNFPDGLKMYLVDRTLCLPAER